MKTGLIPISAWSSLFSLLKLEFIGKNQKEGIPGRLGEQTLPQLTQDGRGNAARAAFPRPWCGQVATPSWWRSLIDDFLLYSSGFLVSAPGFDETTFDCWLQQLDSGRILLNRFSTSLICYDFALIPWFRIYSELNQNLVGFWACFSFLSFSNWAYIKQRRRRLINRIY